MKNQEIISHTLDHLWTTSNLLLGDSLPVSSQLARTLVRNVPEDGMSSFTRKLHCQNCGCLHNLSRVRIRKTKKKVKGKNHIVRRCARCGKVEVQQGTMQKPPKRELIELQHNVEKEKTPKKRKRTSLMSQSSQKSTKNTKKSKRRTDSLGSRRSSASGGDSLATSFLFQPID